MAKRRTINRRRSRRSGNLSAFLNDDTNIIEEDSGYWQYLGQTNSRPPSGVNMTAATEVLDPDSNLFDSNVSTSQYELLRKSTDALPRRSLKKSPRSPENGDNTKENPPEEVSGTESEASNHPKKRRLQIKRSKKPSREVFSIDSSDSEPRSPANRIENSVQHSQKGLSKNLSTSAFDEPVSPPKPQNSKKIGGKSARVVHSPHQSDTSVESEKVRKKRTIFRKPKNIVPETGSQLLGEDSLVLNSQETRKTIIKPRSTYLHKSSDEVSQESTSKASKPSISNSSDSEERVSQPRNIFQQLRSTKPTHNPFAEILDEVADSNEDPSAVSDKAVKSQQDTKSNNNHKRKNNDSEDFELHVTPDASENQENCEKSQNISKKRRKISEESGDSISEELKVSQKRTISEKMKQNPQMEEDDDSGDYHSFNDDDGGDGVIKPGDDNKNDEFQENDQDTVDVNRKPEEAARVLQNSTISRQKTQADHETSIPEDTADDNIIYEASHTKNHSDKSTLINHAPSPVISGSMSQVNVDETDSSISKEQRRRTKTLRSASTISSKTKSPDNDNSTESEEEQSSSRKHSNSNDVHSSESLLRELQKNTMEEMRHDEEEHVEEISGNESIYTPPENKTRTQRLSKSTEIESPPHENAVVIGIVNRPGPKSSKTPVKALGSFPTKSPVESLNESHRLSNSRNSERSPAFKQSGDEFSKSAKSVSKRSVKLASPMNQQEEPSDHELTDEGQISERPGPKSFKLSQKSLSSSRSSVTPKTVGSKRKTREVVQEIQREETASVSESSLNRKSRRRTHPSLYELPDRQRSPSVSVSESEHQESTSSTPLATKRQTTSSKIVTSPSSPRTPLPSPVKARFSRNTAERSISKLQQLENPDDSSSEDEISPPGRKPVGSQTSPNTRSNSSSILTAGVLLESNSPASERAAGKSTTPSANLGMFKKPLVNTSDVSKTPLGRNLLQRPSTSKRLSDLNNENRISFSSSRTQDDAIPSSSKNMRTTEKAKLRQLKIDFLMKSQKSQGTKPTESRGPTTEKEVRELKQKLKDIHKKHIEARERAEAAQPKQPKPKEVPREKFTFKCDEKPPKPKKPVDPAYIVNGKVYKRPKRPRKRTWATDRLYAFLDKKLQPKFGLATRKTSNEFVEYLMEVEKFIMRQKRFEKYESTLDELHVKMAKLGLIQTRFDFMGFCNDYMPKAFRYKIIPIWQPGNTHTIPFEPEKLNIPILSD